MHESGHQSWFTDQSVGAAQTSVDGLRVAERLNAVVQRSKQPTSRVASVETRVVVFVTRLGNYVSIIYLDQILAM